MQLGRRRFVGLGVGAAAAAFLPGQIRADGHRPAAAPLRSPRYDQVSAIGWTAGEQQKNALSILDSFEDDALLKPFRAMGGLPAPGRNLGGWYEYLPDYNWHTGDAGLAPGHAFGQWTSAMARFAAARNDTQQRQRTLHVQHLLGEAITPAFFAQHRFPAYVFDKLNCGLLDAHVLLQAPEAFSILEKIRRCALPSLPGSALERDRVWRKDRDQSYTWDESYTLPENLYLLYQAGAGDAYRTMARAYLLDSFFDPLARGENVLGGLHGYSHVNALCSAVQAWIVDGSEKHLQAALNGYDMIAAQSYATGGWAPDETFEKPASGKLFASLIGTHNSFETPCGNYAFLKLSRYLLQITRDGRYGDAMERLLWNTMFGALPLQPDGRTFYYADFSHDARRVYSDHRWPCCAGTYTQVAADYGINSWMLSPPAEHAVWANLYLPSRLEWQQDNAKLTLSQGLGWPGDPYVLRLLATCPAHFDLMLRIPHWCQSPTLRINGQPTPLHINKGFAQVSRTWSNGDLIELNLPASLRLEPFPADGGPPHPDLVALCFGPWVLLPTEPDTTASANQLLNAERIGPAEWRVRRPAGDLYLAPFFAIHESAYSTYIRLT